MTRSAIYVVDDDAPFGRMISLLLSDESREVVVLSDPNTALDAIRQGRPDLILLDLHIGARNAGLRILAELRRDAATNSTPVILCSGDIDLPTMGLDRATERLPKPFDPEDLMVLVDRLCPPGP